MKEWWEYVPICLSLNNEHVGPPYSLTKIYAARITQGSSSYRSIYAARARPQQQTRRPRCFCRSTEKNRQAERRTDRHSTVLRRLPQTVRTA